MKVNSISKTNVDLDKIQPALMEGISSTSELPSTSKALKVEAPNEIKKNIAENKSNNHKIVHGPDPSKPLRKKAKLLRLEKKSAKSILKKDETYTPSLSKTTKKPKNEEKSLEILLNEIPKNSLHKFQVKIN